MAKDIPIIDLEMDEEPIYVSTLGGRPNEQIPYEVVDVDVENDEIDDCIFKGDDFDLIARPGATEIRFKNKLVIGYMAEEQVGCVISKEQLRDLLTEMLEMYNNRDEIDWSFKNIDLTLLREVYYEFRMLLRLYGFIREDQVLAETVWSCVQYKEFFQYVHAFLDDAWTDQHFTKIEFAEEKEYIRAKVPKYPMRYQTGKRKGQAYWRYGWNELFGISIDFAVSPIASSGRRFILTYADNCLDHHFIFEHLTLVASFVQNMSDLTSKFYFPLWARIQLIGKWSVSSKLEEVQFHDVKVIFIGPLQSYQGGSSEEIIV